MWRVNKTGQEQVWYEAELIEKIKAICKNTCILNHCDCRGCYNCEHIDDGTAIKRILDLIQENEK